MPIGTGRQTQFQQAHYIRKRVNWNDNGIAAGVVAGTFPAGAMVIGAHARVNVAFNAATTNVVTMGTTPTGGEILTSATIVAGTLGYKSANTGTAFSAVFATDTDVYVSFTQSGTAATTGQADLIVVYAPNNDG